jgi:hypothetical protein
MKTYTQTEIAELSMISPSCMQKHLTKCLIPEPSVIAGRRRLYDEEGKDLVVAYFRSLHRSKIEKYRLYFEDEKQ